LRLALTLFLFSVSASVRAQTYTLRAGDVTMQIDSSGARYGFWRSGKPVLAASPAAGLVLAGEAVTHATKILCSPAKCSFRIATASGERGTLEVQLTPHSAQLHFLPMSHGLEVRFVTGGAQPAFGLADDAVLNKNYSTDVTGFADDHFLSGEGLVRLVSNFIIYPAQQFAVLLIDPDTKIVHTSASEIVQGVQHAPAEGTTLQYFFGGMHEIYDDYRLARMHAGYKVFPPKYEMFGVGWEAFGALGWQTDQNTIKASVDRYLSLGYPLQWIVIGSGFWPAPRQFKATTSFGMFDQVKYPDPRALIAHFHDERIKVLLGLRISFITDGPFSADGVAHHYFLSENGQAIVFHGSWPKSPYYLLDAHNPAALDWYMGLTNRWKAFGVDGYKEDFYGYHNLRDDKIDPVNDRLMAEGADIIERNGYLSVDGDLQRVNDFNYNQDQDRGPVNALALAYSGFPFVYPDIVGGTFGEQRFSATRTPAMETYIERNAQWAALHSSMSMGEPPWSFQNPEVGKIMLAAARLHDRLQPYLYSFALRATRDGFPWTMTPLPIAYPERRTTYERENARVRGYEWLIGDALLATPLYGNDYASAGTRDIYLPPGQWMDYDTGKLYPGDTTLTAFALPPEKTPLFVGGSGVVLEKSGGAIVARVYPHAPIGKTIFTLPGAAQNTTVTVSHGRAQTVTVLDGRSSVPARLNRYAWEFAVLPGHTYGVELPRP
jgi:alpha-glucosidase (family GH31 glycosyl hydrolase)